MKEIVETNPRNYSSTDFLGSSYTIVSSSFSPNGDFLVTLELLDDSKFPNRHLQLCQLKVWQRDNGSSQPFKLVQLVHQPMARIEQAAKGLLKFISDKRFLLVSGEQVTVWEKHII